MQKWIRLNGFKLDVSIGIHEFEKVGPQPYKLEIGLKLQTDYWTVSDSISETVDYDHLREQVKHHLRSRHFNLQETVIQDVVEICFDLDERVAAVEVIASKTAVYPDCDSVGLHYIATRQEWTCPKNRTPLASRPLA